jgi:AcrR family transcriptional regulator
VTRPYGRSRRDLARVAVRLFEKRGFAATTVEEIAAAAGYSPRTFHRQFPVKEDVVFYDLPDILSPLQALIEPAGTGAAKRSVWESVRAIVIENSTNWERAGPELAQRRTRLFHDEPALYRRFLEFADEWEAVLARVFAAERGMEPATDARAQVLATTVVGACRAAFRLWLAAPELSLARHMEDALELIESGFGLGGRIRV